MTSGKVLPDKILDEYYKLRETIKSEINTTTKYFKMLTIRDASEYDPKKVLPAQVRGAVIWNQINPNEELLPLDRVITIPLSFDKLHELKDTDIRISQLLLMWS